MEWITVKPVPSGRRALRVHEGQGVGARLVSSVCLLQTAISGANIGVWCLVRIKNVLINVGNDKL